MLCLCYTCSKPVTVSKLAVKIPSGKLSRLFFLCHAWWVSRNPRQHWRVHFSALYTYIFINYLCMYRRVYKWTLPCGRLNFFCKAVSFLFFHGQLRRTMRDFNLHAVLHLPTTQGQPTQNGGLIFSEVDNVVPKLQYRA